MNILGEIMQVMQENAFITWILQKQKITIKDNK